MQGNGGKVIEEERSEKRVERGKVKERERERGSGAAKYSHCSTLCFFYSAMTVQD